MYQNNTTLRPREHFQSAANNSSGGSDINSAYSAGSSIQDLIVPLDVPQEVSASNSMNNITEEESSSGPIGSGIGNLWKFIGIDKLSLKQKQCSYNCGIDALGCMERCATPRCLDQEKLSKEQCKYGCIRKGINCTTNCMADIEQDTDTNQPPMFDSNIISEPTLTLPVSTQVQTTAIYSSPTTSACGPTYDIHPTEVHGVYQNLDGYAPYDMRVWPQHGKYGWTLSELNRMKYNGYNSPNVIEVNIDHSLFPVKSDKPVLQFDLAKSYRQISGDVE